MASKNLRAADPVPDADSGGEASVDPPSSFKHPMVRATAKLFGEFAATVRKNRKLEDEHQATRSREPKMWLVNGPRLMQGRFVSDRTGCLRITATLDRINWILHFHDGLLAAVIAKGCILRGPSAGRKTGASFSAFGVELGFVFAEDFKELPGMRSIAAAKEYRRLDAYKLKLMRQGETVKTWAGSEERLSEAVETIANELFARLEQEAANAKVREEQAAAQRIKDDARRKESDAWFAEQYAKRDRQIARRQQLERASTAGASIQQARAAQELIAAVETSDRASDPAVRAWLTVVRSQLVDPLDAFVQTIIDEGSKPARPMWWPENLAYPAPAP